MTDFSELPKAPKRTPKERKIIAVRDALLYIALIGYALFGLIALLALAAR